MKMTKLFLTAFLKKRIAHTINKVTKPIFKYKGFTHQIVNIFTPTQHNDAVIVSQKNFLIAEAPRW